MAQQIRMPKLSQTMTVGRVVKWLKDEGDTIEKGEPLVTIETDKAMVDLEAPQAGILRRVLAREEEEVEVNSLLGIVSEADEDIEALLMEHPQTSASIPEIHVAPYNIPTKDSRTGRRQPATPAARNLAQELGVDLNRAVGTGREGLITKKDVRALASATTEEPVIEHDEVAQVIPLTGLRGRIAEQLSLSKQSAADVTTVVDVDMSEIARLHADQAHSFTAYVVWAAAQALSEFPILNAWLIDDKILVKRHPHIGIAIALDEGLIVPVIRSTDRKTVSQIAQEIDHLATRARGGLLTASDLGGGTFTVTNSGVFGSLLFTPIINPPEVAILGMGKITDTPVIRDEQIVARKMMYLCLTYDHRAVDGSPAVQFLQTVKRLLEQPREAD